MCLKAVDGRANSVDPDHIAPSDLGLHCLPKPTCLNTILGMITVICFHGILKWDLLLKGSNFSPL